MPRRIVSLLKRALILLEEDYEKKMKRAAFLKLNVARLSEVQYQKLQSHGFSFTPADHINANAVSFWRWHEPEDSETSSEGDERVYEDSESES